MILEKEHLYHIYNQGNNRQRIFFNRDNYLYFLTKVNSYMLPYVNMIAWCLMPNHFHFMVEVKEVQLELNASEFASSENFNPSEALTKDSTANSQGFGDLNIQPKFRTLNDSIGIMLRAYTRAINIQENRSGSLFRNPTKAECITKLDGITPTFFNTAHGAVLNVRMPEKEYPPACWNYIVVPYNDIICLYTNKII